MEVKSDRTRRLIIEKSALLFNRKGYHGTSMSDIMEVTGLAKGGLYGHFKSKDEIVAEAFEFAFYRVMDELAIRIRSGATAIEKLDNIIDYYTDYVDRAPIDGGCPILNYTGHSLDALPLLADLVGKATKSMLDSLQRILEKGIRYDQVRSDIDPAAQAEILYSRIEGALMLGKATQDPVRLRRLMESVRLDMRRDLLPT